ncbi:hypothetical protein ACM913_004010 [Cronobacter sakazakii]
MSTISNDVLEKLSVRYRLLAKIHDGSESQAWEESALIVEELLALRKERERAETVGVPDLHKVVYHFRDLNEGFPVERFKADYVIAWMLANYPPAPSIADDSLPYDPQIAEYEQMMEAEQVQADTTSQQFESLECKAVVADENGNLPCPFCGGRCDPNGWMGSYDDGVPMCGPECEDCGATANSIEEWNRRTTALACKAVVPEGWKLVPVELTKEMRGKIHPFAEALCHGCGREVVADCEDNVTASWNDMLAVAPEPCK